MNGIAWLLAANERLLWQGKPATGLLLRPSDGYLIPLSLVCCGFAVFWEWSVVKSGGPFFFKVFGLVFVGAGLYLVVGRFIVDAFVRSKTLYAVTNQRLMIVSGLFQPEVKSFDLRHLGEVSLTLAAGGRGTIAFGTPLVPSRRLFWPVDDGRSRFEMIERADRVHELIRTAQLQAR